MFSKYKSNPDNYLNNTKRFIEKYSPNIDIKYLLYGIYAEMSDTIFEQHQRGCYILNAVLISVQFIFVIIGLIYSCFGISSVSRYTSFVTILILLFVIVNNYIHNKAWENARKRIKNLDIIIQQIPDIIEDINKSEE